MTGGINRHKIVVGWRERVSLPELALHGIRAKIDTGALTSSLHAYHIEILREDSGPVRSVRFRLPTPACLEARSGTRYQPQLSDKIELPVVGIRRVRSSNGSEELRPVIASILQIGDRELPIELNLTDRGSMGFPMLIGRKALRKGFVVDASASYLLPRSPEVDRSDFAQKV